MAAAEVAIGERHGGRPVLLVPSATLGLRLALQTVGVSHGDEVLCPVVDWPAGYAAVLSLGALPVCVPVDPATLTIAPAAAAAARTRRTRALLATHLHGVAADVVALRHALPGLPVVEDFSQAYGSMLEGRPVGTLGDIAVMSFGPGKPVDAGEAGAVLFAGRRHYKRGVALSAHPVRRLLAGISGEDPAALTMRPHPLAAVLAVYQLDRWDPRPACEAAATVRRLLADVPGVRVLGGDRRRTNALPSVPVAVDHPHQPPPDGLSWSCSTAAVLPAPSRAEASQARRILARVRLARLRHVDGQAHA